MLALAQQMIAIWDEYRHPRNVFADSFDDAILILQKQKQKTRCLRIYTRRKQDSN